MASAASLNPISAEYANADLGDRRRSERVKLIAESLSKQPATGFPRALSSSAELEAFYRFIKCQGFSAADVVAPHISATLARVKAQKCSIAIHDTTTFEYSTERNGFGCTTNAQVDNGFVSHVTLLASESEPIPLGVGYLETWTRCGTKNTRRRAQRSKHRILAQDDPQRESLRWIRGVCAIEDALGESASVVHVTDAEGDFFEFLATLNQRESRFVIRAGHGTRTVSYAGRDQTLREVADQITRPTTHREIELSYRKHKDRSNRSQNSMRPGRSARTAQIAIASTTITIRKSSYFGAKSDSFDVNLVRVWEPKPPRGEPAIEWLLLTTERVRTKSNLERVVDIYRKRWMIEEYFKALKTGCALEKRQVESYGAMCKVLALFVPIAYRILLLRSLERTAPEAKATKAFSRTELTIMANAPSNKGLPPPKSIHDAVLHLARLGGHIRNNGQPGWQTLAWGYEKLLTLRLGWEIAMHEQRRRKCDQS